MTGRLLRSCFAALPLLAALVGCVTDEIVVATLEAGPVDDIMGPGSCASNDDCPPNDLCEKPHCTSLHGHCLHPKVFCPMEAKPSCGCDGITYWTDCLRQQYRVSAAEQNECLDLAVACSGPGGHDCPKPDASCARLLPPGSPCSTDVPGVCWMLPQVCPDNPASETSTSCAAPTICEDTCSAIRSGTVHQRSPMHGCP